MDLLLFSERSIWTMLHGIVLGGGALMALFAALFFLWALRAADASRGAAVQRQARDLAWLTTAAAVALWLAVLVGTYVTFPPYRATPPEGLADLARYPRSMLLASPATAWLHTFAMEIKEHVPWIAAMLTTAVAFVGLRHRAALLRDARLRGAAMWLLAISFVLVAGVTLLGTFVNKVAPLE